MELMLAELDVNGEKRIIAGSIFLCFNKTVVYAFNGSNRQDFELRPNDLIHWNFIQESQKKGFQVYDWGEVSKNQDGLAAYKQKWSSRKLDMFHYYYPDYGEKNEDEIDEGEQKGLLKSIWNIIPLRITSLIGGQVYKYL